MSRDLGRDVPDLEKLYARKLWADFSYPILGVCRKVPQKSPQGPKMDVLDLFGYFGGIFGRPPERRNFWMISGGPFLSRPLCITSEEGGNANFIFWARGDFSERSLGD